MARRRGLRSEVLLSLALLMGTAILVLGGLLLATHESHVRQLHGLAARSLLADARSPLPLLPGERRRDALVVGGRRRSRDAAQRERRRDRRGGAGAGGRGARAGTAAAARGAALAGDPVSRRPSAPRRWRWRGCRRSPRPACSRARCCARSASSRASAPTSCAGAWCARSSSSPAPRARSRAGELGARAPIAGTREIAEVAQAFNAMTEALARRSEALEKAVAELRESNQRLREARAGLDRAERLAAVGRLAAGVAHEVGNPMGALLAFIDLAGRDPGLGRGGREHLARAPARRRARAAHPAPAARLLEPAAGSARADRPGAPVRGDGGAGARAAAATPRIRDRGRRARAIRRRRWPIRRRSRRSCSTCCSTPRTRSCQGDSEPRIRITLRPAAGPRARRRRRTARPRRRGAAGDAVECVVADNGPGIAEEDRERVFDPFFTTKPPGEGTGLGLANAARFAEEFGGTLELLPAEPGGGAVFVLRLPARLEVSSHRHKTRVASAACAARLRTPHAASQPAPAPGSRRDPREPQARRGLGRKRAHGTRLAPSAGQRAERGRSDVSRSDASAGFTLIETMIVVAVIGIMAALVASVLGRRIGRPARQGRRAFGRGPDAARAHRGDPHRHESRRLLPAGSRRRSAGGQQRRRPWRRC